MVLASEKKSPHSRLHRRIGAQKILGTQEVNQSSHLEEQGVASALVGRPLDALDVGHRQVVADHLHLLAVLRVEVDPAGPVVLEFVESGRATGFRYEEKVSDTKNS